MGIAVAVYTGPEKNYWGFIPGREYMGRVDELGKFWTLEHPNLSIDHWFKVERHSDYV